MRCPTAAPSKSILLFSKLILPHTSFASIGLNLHILHFAARYAAPPPTLDRCVPPSPNYYYLQVLVQYWIFNLK